MEIISVDLAKREQMSAEFKAINPRMAVPALVLDDGSLITESVAICRYLNGETPSYTRRSA